VSDQVSRPVKTMCKIVVLYILILHKMSTENVWVISVRCGIYYLRIHVRSNSTVKRLETQIVGGTEENSVLDTWLV
jgi:hypothetical protein